MIPNNITKQHILAAIAEIDLTGTPDRKASRKFAVDYNGRNYPPKYLVSLANRFANGTELPSGVFNGGAETNGFLRSLNFTIKGPSASNGGTPPAQLPPRVPSQAATASPVIAASTSPLTAMPSPGPTATSYAHQAQHTGERCKECKRVVKALLEKIYGPVEENYRVDVGTRPEDYTKSPCYGALGRIFAALKQHRGFTEFVGAKTLPRSDFFVAHPGFIVEFDESQHFTELRRLALSLYPSDLHFGFDLPKWVALCEQMQKRDNDPPHRDEQRAWYDTLRDFAPNLKGWLPTLRLYDCEFEWCALVPENPVDVDTFRQILGERASFWTTEYRIPNNASLARIAIGGAWRGNSRLAKKLLMDISRQWPSGVHVHCLSTCGAFLVFDWPKGIPQQKDNRFPDDKALEILDEIARDHVKRLLGDGLRESLAKCSNYLTLGVDSYKSKISSTGNYIPEPHAELVYIVDLKTGDIHFTGKSYPTGDQEKGLLRVLNLDSHFIRLDGVAAMVVGCHDLTIFHPRSDAKASGWRLQTKNDFKSVAKIQKPKWVLHHPHTTVNPMTWCHAWKGLLSELPSVTSYLGTGCYSYLDKNGLNRKPLQSVLDSTKSPDVGDIIVHLGMSAEKESPSLTTMVP